jgi:hypothetical protein
MSYQPFILRDLKFSGPSKKEASIGFEPGLNLVFGASNAGKSYSLKAIDFMLGSNRELPQIDESLGYDRLSLGLHLPQTGECRLERAMAGGNIKLFTDGNQETNRILGARHDATSDDNLSYFLLQECGLGIKHVAKDANGGKRTLSFRDVVRFCLVDETSIQSETSPSETGQYQSVTVERSILKLMLTGVDDSAIQPVETRKVFQTRNNAKVEVLEDMLTAINDELQSDFPDVDDIEGQGERLDATFGSLNTLVQRAQHSARALIDRKHSLTGTISSRRARIAEIDYNLARFAQLSDVYLSDISRLETLEEAGFMLVVGSDRDCPLCGAPPSAQSHQHGVEEIELVQQAAVAEIAKISRQQSELKATIDQLASEMVESRAALIEQQKELETVEGELRALAPQIDQQQRQLEELIVVRDRIQRGKSLIAQRRDLTLRRDEIAKTKHTPAAEKPKLGVPTTVAHDFAQTVSSVLTEWQFPGKRHVSFDDATYDLKIDGKHRKDNGKGVRAVTHAAFKVALLLFCKERELPHPGFVVLDTPLLTYRDPLKKGPLAADERAIANTSLKDFFFEHLASLRDTAQFIVLENIDPPAGLEAYANLLTFTGDPSTGRQGLF